MLHLLSQLQLPKVIDRVQVSEQLGLKACYR